MIINRLKFSFLTIVSLFVLVGCLNQDLNLTIRYQEVGGLKEGAALIHGDETIGAVEEVIYTSQGDFEVKVAINEPFAALATESALFIITDNPAAETERAVMLITDDAPGSPLADGQVVQGSSAVAGMALELENLLNSTVSSLGSSIEESLQQFSDENVEQHLIYLEQQLDKLIGQAKAFSDSANATFKNDVLPQIKQQIEVLKQQLKSLGKDKSIEPIEKKYRDLEGTLEA